MPRVDPAHLAVGLAAASIFSMCAAARRDATAQRPAHRLSPATHRCARPLAFSRGGVIFGIASLYPVLYYERALESSSCGMPAVDDAGEACAAGSHDQCCDAQQLKYTSITSAALFAADGAMLGYGELGDRLGPRACFGTGACLAWLGLLLLAAGAHFGTDMLWYAALLCIGCSGPGVFMGCLFLGERYPRLHAVISAVGAAMWDASALVFQIFALLYFSTVPSDASQLPAPTVPANPAPTLGLTTIALAWLCMTVVLGALTFQALPSRALLEQLRAAEPSSQPLTQAEDSATPASSKKGKDDAPMAHASPNDGAAEPPSFLSVFCRTDTRLLLCFMGLFNLKSSFYIATFASQMKGMFHGPTAESLSETFNVAFPVGGFCVDFGRVSQVRACRSARALVCPRDFQGNRHCRP